DLPAVEVREDGLLRVLRPVEVAVELLELEQAEEVLHVARPALLGHRVALTAERGAPGAVGHRLAGAGSSEPRYGTSASSRSSFVRCVQLSMPRSTFGTAPRRSSRRVPASLPTMSPAAGHSSHGSACGVALTSSTSWSDARATSCTVYSCRAPHAPA